MVEPRQDQGSSGSRIHVWNIIGLHKYASCLRVAPNPAAQSAFLFIADI